MTNSILINKEKNYISRPRLINKNKEEFKQDLLNYAKSNFSDQIQDFSDASLGGMLLDFASIVGESLTHYIDSQLNELHYETATTEYSIINHLKKANITAGFASPSSTVISFYAFVPIDSTNKKIPDTEYLPVILKETSFASVSGIPFILEEDIDFKNYKIIQELSINSSNNEITHYLLEATGICSSGEITSESFSFSEDDVDSFLSYTFSNENITKVIKVSDNSNSLNEYKQVEFLSQDTIYEKVKLGDSNFFNILPAPFRFILENSFDDGLTTIRFGNGSNKINEDGYFSNPEELSMPLRGRNYTNQISIDPKSLINSTSLGVSPAGKTITVKYKYGGGTDHNVSARSITEIENLKYFFPNLTDKSDFKADAVIQSLSVINKEPSVGGSEALSLEELIQNIPKSLKMQSRIVNHEDLLARLYSMPSDFGRISKAAIYENEYTKVSKDLFIICKDNQGNYINANDAIKYNLSRYINEYRLIGDVFNIIDAPIFNIGISLKIKISNNYDPSDVLNNVQQKIITYMRFETLQIGQGININNIVKIALDTNGVLTVVSNLKNILRSINNNSLTRINSNITNRSYSDNIFSVASNYKDGIVFPPRGGIFELKYSDDIEIFHG